MGSTTGSTVSQPQSQPQQAGGKGPSTPPPQQGQAPQQAGGKGPSQAPQQAGFGNNYGPQSTQASYPAQRPQQQAPQQAGGKGASQPPQQAQPQYGQQSAYPQYGQQQYAMQPPAQFNHFNMQRGQQSGYGQRGQQGQQGFGQLAAQGQFLQPPLAIQQQQQAAMAAQDAARFQQLQQSALTDPSPFLAQKAAQQAGMGQQIPQGVLDSYNQANQGQAQPGAQLAQLAAQQFQSNVQQGTGALGGSTQPAAQQPYTGEGMPGYDQSRAMNQQGNQIPQGVLDNYNRVNQGQQGYQPFQPQQFLGNIQQGAGVLGGSQQPVGLGQYGGAGQQATAQQAGPSVYDTPGYMSGAPNQTPTAPSGNPFQLFDAFKQAQNQQGGGAQAASQPAAQQPYTGEGMPGSSIGQPSTGGPSQRYTPKPQYGQ